MVSTPNGIFIIHIRSRNDEYIAQQWRLSRRVYGGMTFTNVYAVASPHHSRVYTISFADGGCFQRGFQTDIRRFGPVVFIEG